MAAGFPWAVWAKGKKVTTLNLKSVKKPVKAIGLTGKKDTSVNIFEVIWK